ncbi:hypothetical protein HUG17_9897 [Dermatophagoides farinae]|uniref:RNA-directed DNA polymerase n=1 Tax=Dermatophagoides farinae TaxID=6954 RepID=A0A9D4SJ12_DERFA|nr:hypothetical protein HUG17_9897 [Dermatophagoides farinae]
MVEYFHKIQGHIGQKQTALHYSQNYYTPNQNEIIHEAVHNCSTCLQAKRVRCKKIDYPNISWYRLAEEILEEYNSTIHTVTGYTPYFLLFAEERYNDYLREPIEDIESYRSDAFVKSSMDHKRNQLYYDKRRKNWQFSIGDWVYAKIADDLNRNKLDPRYEGPFEIINRCSDVIYVLNVAGNEVTSHIENMKPLNTRTGYRGYTIIDDESIESDDE